MLSQKRVIAMLATPAFRAKAFRGGSRRPRVAPPAPAPEAQTEVTV